MRLIASDLSPAHPLSLRQGKREAPTRPHISPCPYQRPLTSRLSKKPERDRQWWTEQGGREALPLQVPPSERDPTMGDDGTVGAIPCGCPAGRAKASPAPTDCPQKSKRGITILDGTGRGNPLRLPCCGYRCLTLAQNISLKLEWFFVYKHPQLLRRPPQNAMRPVFCDACLPIPCHSIVSLCLYVHMADVE